MEKLKSIEGVVLEQLHTCEIFFLKNIQRYFQAPDSVDSKDPLHTFIGLKQGNITALEEFAQREKIEDTQAYWAKKRNLLEPFCCYLMLNEKKLEKVLIQSEAPFKFYMQFFENQRSITALQQAFINSAVNLWEGLIKDWMVLVLDEPLCAYSEKYDSATKKLTSLNSKRTHLLMQLTEQKQDDERCASLVALSQNMNATLEKVSEDMARFSVEFELAAANKEAHLKNAQRLTNIIGAREHKIFDRFRGSYTFVEWKSTLSKAVKKAIEEAQETETSR